MEVVGAFVRPELHFCCKDHMEQFPRDQLDRALRDGLSLLAEQLFLLFIHSDVLVETIVTTLQRDVTRQEGQQDGSRAVL